MEIKSVSNSVLDYLRAQIITGRLAANKKLNESELSSLLGISRPPVREAFRTLEHEHLVTSIPRKGTYVSDMSYNNLVEVYQAREMIECYAIDLLKNKKDLSLSTMEEALKDTSNLSPPEIQEPDQLLAFHRKLAEFHLKLVELGGNSKLIHFYQDIFFNLARYQFKFLRIPGTVPTNLEEHRRILNALIEADYNGAKEILRFHLKKRLQEWSFQLTY